MRLNAIAPFDWLLNLGPVPYWPELRARAPTLCVLQHGLIRSAWSLERLARTLRRHGYEVLNPGYWSTTARIEAPAERLAAKLERRLAAPAGPLPRLAFVGHSMGGLVIRSYLARPDARPAFACVFLATPQRGAKLAAVRHRLWPMRVVLGRNAPLQLIPGDPLYTSLPPVTAERIGVLCGGKGDGVGWNRHLDGDDDGTVAVDEARLDEAHDTLVLRLGHTRITTAPQTLRQVLHFLAEGRFEHAPHARRASSR
ncbi:MAG: hypothetical protein IT457_21820 [Planctomycetes bacterium]|nr:hypothetical protein [Planctomycetota bacterium]